MPASPFGCFRPLRQAGSEGLRHGQAHPRRRPLHPEWPEAQLLHARTLLLSGRSEEALAIARELAEQYDNTTLKPNASIRTGSPLRLGQRSHTQVFDGGSIQDARLYSRAVDAAEVKQIASLGPLRAILAAASDKRTPAQRNALYEHYLITRDDEYQELNKSVVTLEGERDAIKGRS